MRKSLWVLLLGVVALAGVAAADDAGYTDPAVTAESRSLPEYPPAALAAGYSGTVSVAAVVNADGSVGAVEVLENTRPGLGFETAALAAIKTWEFRPARVDGQAVDAVGAFVFRFESVGRISPTARVAGEFLLSQAILGGIGGAGRADKPGFAADGAFSPARSLNKDAFVKPRLPPAKLGAMYNRKDLLPQPQREVGGRAAAAGK